MLIPPSWHALDCDTEAQCGSKKWCHAANFRQSPSQLRLDCLCMDKAVHESGKQRRNEDVLPLSHGLQLAATLSDDGKELVERKSRLQLSVQRVHAELT